MESDGTFRINKKYQSEYTFKIERLQYQGLLGQPGNIKIELDRHQNVLYPGIITDYRNIWQINTKANVMDPREICAEKIRAVAQRARYRDFYDLYFLITTLEIDFIEAVRILQQKEIRTPIKSKNIASNWVVAKEQQARDISAIYCSEELTNDEVEKLIEELQFDDIE